ncbi:MAG: hypothetical protein M0R17_04345 [Candidatus Omnitrophica bacterium]|jgi:hypothetical protein|nr:hypothetical protein [Candidatus Omnitrophota bacterium]
METLELWDTNTGINWWNEARTYLNEAIKAYNKYITGHIPLKKLEKKVKKSYRTLIEKGYCVDYDKDFSTILELFMKQDLDTSWYNGFD